jgi:hypothetical protein
MSKFLNLLKRLFTSKKFTGRTGGVADKTVGEVYDVHCTRSKEDGKILVMLGKKEENGQNISGT